QHAAFHFLNGITKRFFLTFDTKCRNHHFIEVTCSWFQPNTDSVLMAYLDFLVAKMDSTDYKYRIGARNLDVEPPNFIQADPVGGTLFNNSRARNCCALFVLDCS